MRRAYPLKPKVGFRVWYAACGFALANVILAFFERHICRAAVPGSIYSCRNGKLEIWKWH